MCPRHRAPTLTSRTPFAEQAASATDAAKPNGETAGDPAPLAGNVGAAAAFAALAGAKAGVGSPMPGVAGVAAAGSPMPSFSSWSPAQEGGGVIPNP